MSVIAVITVVVAAVTIKRKREYLTKCYCLWRVIKDSDFRIVSFHPFIVATVSEPELNLDFKLVHLVECSSEALSKKAHVS